jgi:hypothetical protein
MNSGDYERAVEVVRDRLESGTVGHLLETQLADTLIQSGKKGLNQWWANSPSGALGGKGDLAVSLADGLTRPWSSFTAISETPAVSVWESDRGQRQSGSSCE